VRIFLFCRYPELGEVKSRLAAHCGQEKALLLYKKMLSTVLENIDNSGRPMVVHYTGCSTSAAVEWFASRQIKPQSDGDLGEKLLSAVKEGFDENKTSIVLIGADCPGINADSLEEVERELKINDLVIGPAVDGGYYLLALKECIEPLFRGITWGTSQVLKQTLEIAAKENLKVKLLEEKNDMDYWEDIPAEWRQEVDC
jgi:rSAM/selenodomain-associated transferase 1